MTRAKLSWDHDQHGIRFWLQGEGGGRISVDQWGAHDIVTSRGAGSIAHLLAMADDDVIEVDKDEVTLAHSQVAELGPVQLERLGLPSSAPWRLELRGSGLLSSPSFRFQHRLIGADGRAILGARRAGVLVEVAKATFTLLDPIYSLLEGVEAFNSVPPADTDERFLRWAELKALLPEDALVDQHLRSMNIARADAFTLDYSDDGQVHPVLISRARGDAALGAPAEPGREALTPHAQRSFAQRFGRLSQAQARYALEGSWYVVLGAPLQRALSVVREVQDRPAEERRALLDNPVGLLKDRLGADLAEREIEALFEETPAYLSARVRGLGEWHPKLCAYVLPSQQKWLPPEEAIFGVALGGKIVQMAIKDVPAVMEGVKQAIAQGVQEIELDGQRIPASDETLETLRRLAGEPRVSSTSVEEKDSQPEERPLVPLIIDNLEEIGYATEQRTRRGEVGGLPAALRTVRLYEHQQAGLNWLQRHWADGSPGGLLADDMGLGKTLQTLAFLAWVKEQMEQGNYPHKPFLVVAPTGLLKNWEDEANTHLAPPGLGGVFRAFGPDLKALAALTHREQIGTLSDANWVLTTYETLRDRIRLFIGVDWGVAALDEAQKIKNPTSRMSEMAKSIKADFTLALTGTPVENRLVDLWSIIDATNAGLLGSLKEFHKTFEKPANDEPDTAAPLSRLLLEESEPPVMLRRMKEDHLKGLPEKRQRLIREEMPREQAAAYEAVVASAAALAGERGAMLEVLHRLRKVSLIAQPLGVEGLTDTDVDASARLKASIQILDGLYERGEKALLFIEYLDLQEALIPFLQRRYDLPKPPLRVSGDVSGSKRKQRVDEFQSREEGKFDVMLLSPKAGGVGLTLTAANHVIHLSRWWNPAVEDQCTDRVYRIGQTKTVQVHIPLAIHPKFQEHSFDVNLHALLERKRELSRSVLAPSVATDQDMAHLFASTVQA